MIEPKLANTLLPCWARPPLKGAAFVAGFFLLAALLTFFIEDPYNLIPHRRISGVFIPIGESWLDGEYRSCDTMRGLFSSLLLRCAGPAPSESHVFRVTYFGAVDKKERDWRCQRDDSYFSSGKIVCRPTDGLEP
jgi:hypothetical protein